MAPLDNAWVRLNLWIDRRLGLTTITDAEYKRHGHVSELDRQLSELAEECAALRDRHPTPKGEDT
jgi:hypothetical protein